MFAVFNNQILRNFLILRYFRDAAAQAANVKIRF